MADQRQVFRGIVIGLLAMMVLRGVDWLLNAPASATSAEYALQMGTMLICGATAWATWRPAAGVEALLQRAATRR